MSLPPAHCPNKEENDVHSTVSLEEIDFKNREVTNRARMGGEKAGSAEGKLQSAARGASYNVVLQLLLR